jgi:serpin B
MNTYSQHALIRLSLLVVALAIAPSGVACAQSAALVAASDAAIEFSRSNNALAFDLYAKARVQPGNLALSPISISTALTMTWAGARGDTAAEMQRVLHLNEDGEAPLHAAAALLADLHQEDGGATLHIVNRLFGAESFEFDTRYLDQTKTFFGAALEPLNFTDADQSRRHINDWVAKETAERIQNLIPVGALRPETRLVLVNAIYFLGQWTHPFTAESTVPIPFRAIAGEAHAVPTMQQVEDLPFAQTDGVKLLELAYRGSDVSMLLVLPDAADGLEAVERRLSPTVLEHWLGAIGTQLVFVALPKFEINPAQSLALSDTLSALGMPLAFDSDHADFSGISDPSNHDGRLYISDVFHKAFVKLDELGTEAAAATAVVAVETSAAPPSGPPPELFRADHPFLFVLRHVPTGAILFIGRVNDPL